jgi:hypothetical protein
MDSGLKREAPADINLHAAIGPGNKVGARASARFNVILRDCTEAV